MSAKPADRDEVAMLMQQQGLSRVQATKLLYEMTKQRKKEEAAAAAARAGNKSPILEIIQNDTSVVKQHIERYSSQKELVSAQSQLHMDLDFSSSRPALRLDPETASRYKSVGSVGVMSAAIESKYNINVNSSSAKSQNTSNGAANGNDDDDLGDETVESFDEDKFAYESQMLSQLPMEEELSPTAVAAAAGTSPATRRRSSNSALDLRPLSRLHPTKFGKEGDGLTNGGIDEDLDVAAGQGQGQGEEGYRSGDSSDGEFEEPAALSTPPQTATTAASTAQETLQVAPIEQTQFIDSTQAPAAAPVPIPAYVPEVSSPPSGIVQGASTTDGVRTGTAARAYSSDSQPPEFDSDEGSSAFSTKFSSSATLTSTATSESKSFSSRTLTGRVQSQPLLPVQQLALEEKVALINAGRYTAPTSAPANTGGGGGAQPAGMSAVLSPSARANEVTNVKVGSKKLTVRASFNAGSAKAGAAAIGLEPPPPYADFPPPPAYDDDAAAPFSSPAATHAPAAALSVPTMKSPGSAMTRPLPTAPASMATDASTLPMSQPAPVPVMKRPIPPPQSGSSGKEYSNALTPVPEELLSPSVSPAALPPTIPPGGETTLDFQGPDIEDDGSEEESFSAKKFNRRSYIKKDNLPEAFKNLAPIDESEIQELMRREHVERAAGASLEAQRALEASQPSPIPGPATQKTPALMGTVSTTTGLTLETTFSQGSESAAWSSITPQLTPLGPPGTSSKEGTDLVQELMSQGYSRENAVSLAKEIEMDRRADRFARASTAAAPGSHSSYAGLGAPPRSGSSVVSHTSSLNYNGYGRDRQSFDRSFTNEDETGSVVSNISAASRQSSVCESDKLLMNLLLSQQKGKYGVNMYESLTNQDEPAIERYMGRGLTLDQAVLKVFEKKYGAVENQNMPRSIHTASSNGSMGSSKAPSTVPYDSSGSHEIVDTMHAEIELLMLSGGYSRDVAVKMLLNKVAKEKGVQSQNTSRTHEIDNHQMHRAASMNAIPIPRGPPSDSDGFLPAAHRLVQHEPQGYHVEQTQQPQYPHPHTLHSSRSMYAMPSSSSGASVNGGGSVASGRSSRSRTDQLPPSHGAPPVQSFPTQYPPQHVPHSYHPSQQAPDAAAFPTQLPPHSGHSGHGSHRRPSASNISVASGKMSVASGASSITKLDSRDSRDNDYISSVVAQQEATYGVNMYDYLAPDDPEVARLMGQFGFNKLDAMIAVFQQFPPQVAPRSSGSRAAPGPSNGGPAPGRTAPSTASSHRRTAEPPPVSQKKSAYDEEAELERVLRLSMLEQQNTPGAVSMPGLGGGTVPRNGGSNGGAYGAPPPARHGAPAPLSNGHGHGHGHGHGGRQQASNQDIMSLVGMGFNAHQAQEALARNNFDVHAAADYLLRGM